jgi:hypothetical protein
MTTLAEIRAWVGREAMRGGKVPSGMTVVDAEELDALLAAFPADSVLVTPKALGSAIEDHFATGRHGWSYTSCATAVVMALTGVAEEESDVAHADAPGPLRAEGAPSEGARLG